MNDILLQLAFAVNNNPGVFALLLGSGVSRAAEIPTGWDIVVDLINRVAVAMTGVAPVDPHKWYIEEFKEEPRYDVLLQKLGNMPSERRAILQGYFEPSEEERPKGVKLPTQAHRAVASLIKDGYIKVVLTTNFDRLLEMALDEVAIVPDVISTDDMVLGARPLQHSTATIIKVNGDYRDERIRNTATELEDYSNSMKKLLDQVFDSYGLIVCGWSADWDKALRDTIYRATTRRYSTYWTLHGEPSENAKHLIQRRDAQTLPILDADTFFHEVSETVKALAFTKRKHPLSVVTAVARVKGLIPQETGQIELEDLVRHAVQEAYEGFTSSEFLARRELAINRSASSMLDDVGVLYFSSTELALNVLATLEWYGSNSGRQPHYVMDAIKRWAEASEKESYMWAYLPIVLLMYVCGIAAAHNRNWSHLSTIFDQSRIMTFGSQDYSPVLKEIVENFFLGYARAFDHAQPLNANIYSAPKRFVNQDNTKRT